MRLLKKLRYEIQDGNSLRQNKSGILITFQQLLYCSNIFFSVIKQLIQINSIWPRINPNI